MKSPIRPDTPIGEKITRALEDCMMGDHTMRAGVCLDCGMAGAPGCPAHPCGHCGDCTSCRLNNCPPARCPHPAKQNCSYCGERFCPNDGCDPNHRENCREAMRP